jgi:acetyl-CoA C-acetyltransferase
MEFREALICEPVRTAVGRQGGVFKEASVQFLGAAVIRGVLERSGLPAEAVEDVLFAQCYPSMDAPALGRVAALDAGLPIGVGGLQIDRRCGSGLQAIIYASLQVASGASDVVLAGGAESMSNAPFYSCEGRYGIKGGSITYHDSLARGRVTAGGVNFPVPGGMIETAENLRREFSISRLEQDEFAVRSHANAVSAQQRGASASEIVPVTLKTRKGDVVVDTDEHPRADTTVETLGGLRPMLQGKVEGATVTAGNASGQNDAASVCIVASREAVDRYGLRPLGRLVSWSVAGVEPARMGIGPVPSAARALDRAGLTMADMDLIELNEAFAAQALACTRSWGFGADDLARLNVNGSGISIGHPVGATGGRMVASLLRELERRQARRGLATLCIGGGQGIAAILERA